jgi:hypothetical protein
MSSLRCYIEISCRLWRVEANSESFSFLGRIICIQSYFPFSSPCPGPFTSPFTASQPNFLPPKSNHQPEPFIALISNIAKQVIMLHLVSRFSGHTGVRSYAKAVSIHAYKHSLLLLSKMSFIANLLAKILPTRILLTKQLLAKNFHSTIKTSSHPRPELINFAPSIANSRRLQHPLHQTQHGSYPAVPIH